MSSVPKPEVTTYSDACSADPQRHQVLYEDDHIRVLRVRYGAHEQSVMHGHPSTLIIPLTTSKLRYTDYKGHTTVVEAQAWQTMQISVGIHRPENLGDKAFDAIAVEFKYRRPTSMSWLAPTLELKLARGGTF
jgi:hypothetical protein